MSVKEAEEKEEGLFKRIINAIKGFVIEPEEEDEEKDYGNNDKKYDSFSFRFAQIVPSSIEDVEAAAVSYKHGSALFVNYQQTQEEIQRREKDFLLGLVYACDGSYKKLNANLFLYLPAKGDVRTERILTFDAIQDLADHYRAAKPLIVIRDVENLNAWKRVNDFLSGVCLSVDGSFRQLQEDIVLYLPAGMELVNLNRK